VVERVVVAMVVAAVKVVVKDELESAPAEYQ
jgi:hypothetical protein